MFIGAINKGKSLQGYLIKGLLDPKTLQSRHGLIAKEMLLRDFKHNSPLPYAKCKLKGKVNIKANIKELAKRCNECRKRIERGSK